MARCPTHPWCYADDCTICLKKIERRELSLSDPDPDGWQAEQARYERELESHWP